LSVLQAPKCCQSYGVNDASLDEAKGVLRVASIS
jgi:hypothetical protein